MVSVNVNWIMNNQVLNLIVICLIASFVAYKTDAYDCEDYRSSCNSYCGGDELVDQFQCSESQLGYGGLHTCACKAQPQLFRSLTICQTYKEKCAKYCGNQEVISPEPGTLEIICEPEGTNSLEFSCECAPESDSPATPSFQCYDYLPASEGSCEDRKFWGSCNEYWMRNKYFCAETCGLCEWGEAQKYDCRSEYEECGKSCQGSKDNIKEFACYMEFKKFDCICNDGIERVRVIPEGQVVFDPDCYDVLPEKEGTCEMRFRWGSCEEYWMRDKNYCARTCGFCTPKTISEMSPLLSTPPPPPSSPLIAPTSMVTDSIPLVQLPPLSLPPTRVISPLDPSPIMLEMPPLSLPEQLNVSQIVMSEEIAPVLQNGQGNKNISSEQDSDEEDFQFLGRGFQLSEILNATENGPQQTQEEDDTYAETWVSLHNKFRNLHCAPAMTWSEEIAQVALDISSECMYVESTQYGQNFYRATGYGTIDDVEDLIDYIVSYWYNQGIQNGFNLTHPKFLSDAGTTTQVIWKSSNLIGCGYKECDDGWLYANCLYLQPGNVVQAFLNNVEALCR